MSKAPAATSLMPTPVGVSPRQPTFAPGQHRMPGRPSSLNPEVEAEFMTALRNGTSVRAAARAAGLRPKTVEEWLSRGRGNDPDRPPKPEYVRFLRLAEQNRAKAEVFVVGNLVARTRVDTRAAEIWLRHMGGPEWSDDGALPTPTGTEVVPQSPVTYDQREQTVNFVVLPPEQVNDVVRSLLADKRAKRIDLPVSDVEEEPHHGPSGTRTAGLREDG